MNEQLKAKNISGARFPHPHGYVMHTGFGVYHQEQKAWMSLDGGKTPYVPIGGRKTAVSVAATVDMSRVHYISEIQPAAETAGGL